jgi:hypothetical protein
VPEDVCLSGYYSHQTGVLPKPMTYLENVLKCAQLGLKMCEQTCKSGGTNGCNYDKIMVWSGLLCATPPKPPPSPPPLPPPAPLSPPLPPFPTSGVYALNGDDRNCDDPSLIDTAACEGAGVCVYDSTALADPDEGELIAPQCCYGDGTCARFIETNNDAGCIGGYYSQTQNSLSKPMTFFETKATCEALGLVLCERSCRVSGCVYDKIKVWTSLPCPTASAGANLSDGEVAGVAVAISVGVVALILIIVCSLHFLKKIYKHSKALEEKAKSMSSIELTAADDMESPTDFMKAATATTPKSAPAAPKAAATAPKAPKAPVGRVLKVSGLAPTAPAEDIKSELAPFGATIVDKKAGMTEACVLFRTAEGAAEALEAAKAGSFMSVTMSMSVTLLAGQELDTYWQGVQRRGSNAMKSPSAAAQRM